MSICQQQLTDWLRESFQTAFGDVADWNTIRVQPSTNPDFGDFQCNDAMALARQLRKPPRQIAEEVLQAIDKPSFVTSVQVAGAGFININVDNRWLAESLIVQTNLPELGIPQIGNGATVVIDYSSPNVAKPMHIGHIRSTIIGNALDKLFRLLGYKVIADNHLGDWGTQFGILIKGFRAFVDADKLAKEPIEELERVYVLSYNRTREDAAWLDACRNELVKLQQGDLENRALWEKFIELSINEFNRIYERLGISFDLYRGESFYNDKLAGTVELLNHRGLASESEGAIIVNMEEDGLGVCIVRKSDGGFNYATSDIATVISRIEEFSPERIIYVTDERQQLHFKQFFNVARKLELSTQLEHVWFGLMRLPEGTFSTRQGNVIKLEALLDEAERRALAIIEESSPEMDSEHKQELAKAIGIGAVKYADLSHDPKNAIVFTWDRAMALDGNSGPYLQYAHARICSLLDKFSALEPNADIENFNVHLDTPVERQLALQLLQFPATIVRAAETYQPNLLADYLFTLSQTYSSFYQQMPVLKAEQPIRDSRVRLCLLVAEVLRKGLGILGIQAPERI